MVFGLSSPGFRFKALIVSEIIRKKKDLSNSIPAATARPVHLLGSEDYIKACSTRTAMSRQALTMTFPNLTEVALASDDYPKYLKPTRKLLSKFGDIVNASVREISV